MSEPIKFSAQTDRELLVQIAQRLNDVCATLPDIRTRMDSIEGIARNNNNRIGILEIKYGQFSGARLPINLYALAVGIGGAMAGLLTVLGKNLGWWEK